MAERVGWCERAPSSDVNLGNRLDVLPAAGAFPDPRAGCKTRVRTLGDVASQQAHGVAEGFIDHKLESGSTVVRERPTALIGRIQPREISVETSARTV
jgi:hypothetical protein